MKIALNIYFSPFKITAKFKLNFSLGYVPAITGYALTHGEIEEGKRNMKMTQKYHIASFETAVKKTMHRNENCRKLLFLFCVAMSKFYCGGVA